MIVFHPYSRSGAYSRYIQFLYILSFGIVVEYIKITCDDKGNNSAKPDSSANFKIGENLYILYGTLKLVFRIFKS